MTALLESSVVRFYSKSGAVIGAGFLVSQKHILTCAHVVADALEIERETAEMPDEEVNLDFPILAPQQLFKARVVFWRPINPNEFEEDIAGLELESSPPDTAQPAQLLTSEDLWGHSFRVLGFPEGQPNGASASGELRGRLANGWVQLEDVKQPGYRLEPGFSGAPVWDEQLQGVVGMAVAAEMNRPEVKAAFIIPTNLLLSAWTFLGEQAIPACPYRGLFAFQQKDAPFFFGRETFTEQLMAAVQKKSLVAVIGPSGSGKSSVVFAGLIPRLQQVGAQGLAPLHIASFRPGDRPFRNLARQLVPLLETQMSEIDQLVEVNKLATALQQGNLALQDVVTRIQEKNSGDRLLLVADQFEELYTLCQDVQERQIFLIRLLEAVNQTRNFNLVLTLRADFLGYALSYRPFADALQNADVKLGPLNRQELQDAVQKPAEKQGVKLEQGLTERILEAVAEEPGNLPLLEFALTQLWEKQSNGKLTHAAYDAIGGVEKALSNHADDVYAQLTDEEQKQVQKIFIQLVRPGEGTADTRRQATRAEVGEENWDLVKRLADERLVVSDRKKTAGEAEEETVEIVHEALIREWQRLRKWMNNDRAFRLWQERLRAVMHHWESSGKDKGALLRGVSLAEAQRWWRERPNDLQLEKTFILVSLNLRKQQRLLRIVGSLSIFMALALPGVQWWQQKLDQVEQEELSKKISNVQLIDKTKALFIKSFAVTEDAVWMAVNDKEGKGLGIRRYELSNKDKPLNQYQAKDASNIKDDRVTALLVEKKDIWIGVKEQGVMHSSLNPVRFKQILSSNDYISSLVRDANNRLWVGTLNGSVYRLPLEETNQNQPLAKTQLINIKPYCSTVFSSSQSIRIERMAINYKNDMLWIATSNGLIKWNLQEEKDSVECYPKQECQTAENALDSKPNFLTAIAFDSRGRPWVGTKEGFVKKLQPNGCWLSSKLISKSEIKFLAALPNDSFLAVSLNDGAFLYSSITNDSIQLPMSIGIMKHIHTVDLRPDGHLWMGTKQGLFRTVKPITP
jgi:energy-coupling factor transporter ATP-binding protein EcfA2